MYSCQKIKDVYNKYYKGKASLEEILNYGDLALTRLSSINFPRLSKKVGDVTSIFNKDFLESIYFPLYISTFSTMPNLTQNSNNANLFQFATTVNPKDIADYEMVRKILFSVTNQVTLYYMCKTACSKTAIKYDSYINDLNIMSLVTEREILSSLLTVSTNEVSLKGQYHNEDMMTIASASDLKIIEALTVVACNKNSLNSVNHVEDMHLIATAPFYGYASCIVEAACNENSELREAFKELIELENNFNLEKEQSRKIRKIGKKN